MASRNEALEKELAASRKRSAELEERASDAIIRGLENRAHPEDGAPLVAALGEPFAKVRKYAATGLAKLKAPEAEKKLSELALGDSSAEVRAECVTALGVLGSGETAAVLIRALGDSEEGVSASAARALGRVKAGSAVNPLLLALLSRSSTVRGAASGALGEIGAAAAVDPLVELLRNDPDVGVRSQAARALGAIPGKSAARVAALEKALGDKSPAVRVYVVEALGALGASETADEIRAVLTGDANPSVREAAAVALGKMDGGESLDLLIQMLDHTQEKLAQLAFSSILAICQRDGKLCEPTADRLVRAGHAGEAAKLYEMYVQKPSDGKPDDERLTPVRVKLVDVYCTLEQWTKAASLLEELTRRMPASVSLGEKYARALTELRRHSEAFHVYENLSALRDNADYWSQREVLLEIMRTEGKTAEAMKLAESALGGQGKATPPEDVRKRLEAFRQRCAETMREK
jgi:HEAT repeat protein